MPDVIIKGMEMPERCIDCLVISQCKNARPLQHRPEDCHLAPANRWIPADKPPKPGERVILRAGVFVGEGYFTSAHTWRRITGRPMRDLTDDSVTEWMPLPEVTE